MRVLAVPATVPEPKPPVGVRKAVLASWHTFWQSPMARHVLETDHLALRRLFRMYEQREKFLEEGLEAPVVEGSQHQPILSAYLREVDVLDTKILALEDRFGMSPLSRLKLQVIVGDASRSIAETNARAASGALETEPDDDDEDLRRPAKRVSGAKV